MEKWKWPAIGFVVFYLAFPILAGVLKLGPDQQGPVFYHPGHHSALYKIGFAFVSDDKPRLIMGGKRGWFYTFTKES